MTPQVIALLIAGVVLAWIAFWIAVVRLIARFGGWRRLAEAYPVDRLAFEGTRFTLQSAVLRRFVSYSCAITFTAGRDGLLLTVMWMFRPGHRPILLPWSDLSATSGTRRAGKGLRGPVVRLEARRLPEVPITISRKLADRLAEAAGDDWPQFVDEPAAHS